MSLSIAFIGRQTHVKTQSDVYLIELMKQHGETTVFRREDQGNNELAAKVNLLKPDLVLFFQERPSWTHHLLKIKSKHFVWLPMWDGFKGLDFRKRLAYKFFKLKVISHCLKVHEYLDGIGIGSLYAQYFMEPDFKQEYHDAGPYTFLLWQRCDSIDMNYLLKIVGAENVKKIIYKGNQPDQSIPAGIEVEVIKHWLEEEEYTELIKSADYFIAPRKKEGIGMSFIKALSHGVPVIAFDEATMNEYVVPDVNGYLCDENPIQGLKSPRALSEGLQKHYTEGYNRWRSMENSLLDFIFNHKNNG